ncbi:SGNH/GDSL hydrolase family protein [Carnobacterium gallinarum]|uniref:SGNH/GDSL hydrolase family protein n=1 Tax=Carnobacterium gallinarum TaxID=2749 RepID=UPI003CCBE448
MKPLNKIILLGDSITAGYMEDHVSQALTSRIRQQLSKDIRVQNVGIPGDTTVGALERLEKHVLKGEPDFVTILFGSNDVLLTENISLERYQKNIETMIQMIGSQKVLLITPSFSNQLVQHEERPNHRILAYGNTIRQLAHHYQTQLIDLQSAMLDAPNYTDFLQADGFHFNEFGYDLLANLIIAKLK